MCCLERYYVQRRLPMFFMFMSKACVIMDTMAENQV